MLQPGVLLLQDVFSVKVKRRRAVGQQSGGAVLGVALFHCRRRGKRLEEDTLHLHNASAEHTHTWYNTLKEQLIGNTHLDDRAMYKESTKRLNFTCFVAFPFVIIFYWYFRTFLFYSMMAENILQALIH